MMTATGGPRRPSPALVISLMAACAFPLARHLMSAFVTAADANTAQYAIAARNLLRHRPVDTKLGLAMDPGGPPAPPVVFNTHHPPLMAMGAAAAEATLGVSEGAARAYPAACSLGSALLVFILWRRHRGDGQAALACLMMATLPGFSHFGKMLGEEAPTLFFSLLTLACYRARGESGGHDARRGWPVACLTAYAASCLSGWAGFYIGPLLLLHAWLVGRGRRGPDRRALAGIAITGAICFALIVGQIALIAGSTVPLLDAASNRLSGPAVTPFGQEAAAWLRRVGGYLPRVIGLPAGALVLVGGLSAALRVAGKRAHREAVADLVVLLGLGLSHPLFFPGAAFYHDWLLFQLLPITAIAMAEGALLVAVSVSRILKPMGAPDRLARAAGLCAIAILLAHRAEVCATGVLALEDDQPQHAPALLGLAVSEAAPTGSLVASNFPMHGHPIVYYADRRTALASTREQVDLLVGTAGCSLYVRDLNLPMERELEELLSLHLSREVGAFRLYSLSGGSPGGVEPAFFREDRGRQSGASSALLVDSGPIEARFGEAAILKTCHVLLPPSLPRPRTWWRRYLIGPSPRAAEGTVVRVMCDWSAPLEIPRGWTVQSALTYDEAAGAPSLPLLTLPEMKHASLSLWGGEAEFQLRSVFLATEGSPAGAYVLRFAVTERGRLVRPVLPGPPRPQLKLVVAARFELSR